MSRASVDFHDCIAEATQQRGDCLQFDGPCLQIQARPAHFGIVTGTLSGAGDYTSLNRPYYVLTVGIKAPYPCIM